MSLQMAPLKAHGKQDGLWLCCWAGTSNYFSFLIVSLLLQGQCLGPMSYGLGPPRAHVEAEPALSFLSQQALL